MPVENYKSHARYAKRDAKMWICETMYSANFASL